MLIAIVSSTLIDQRYHLCICDSSQRLAKKGHEKKTRVLIAHFDIMNNTLNLYNAFQDTKVLN